MRVKFINYTSKETNEIDQIRLILRVRYNHNLSSIQSEISRADSLAPIFRETRLILKSRWKLAVSVFAIIVVILLSLVLCEFLFRKRMCPNG